MKTPTMTKTDTRLPKTKISSWFIRILISGILSALLSTGYLIYRDRNTDQDFRKRTVQRIEQLERMKSDLLDFAKFIEAQRRLIQDTEVQLSSILEEHRKYKSLVEMDKGEIQLVMGYYEERMAQAEVRNYFIGAVIGIITSIIASWLYGQLPAFREKLKNRRIN